MPMRKELASYGCNWLVHEKYSQVVVPTVKGETVKGKSVEVNRGGVVVEDEV